MSKKETDRILNAMQGLLGEIRDVREEMNERLPPPKKGKGRPCHDLIGQTFGKLSVVERGTGFIDTKGRNRAAWNCICECGRKLMNVLPYNLKKTRSCKVCSNTKHGHTEGCRPTTTHKAWDNMIQRCTNKNRNNWKDYGGRGITVCKEWKHSFKTFLEDMGDKPRGLTLDRIDNDGNYEPGNCRWTTNKVQQNNKRNSKKYE